MTLNTYSHVLPSMQSEAAEGLDELLSTMQVSDASKQITESKQLYKNDLGQNKKRAVVKRALGVEGLFLSPFLGVFRHILPTFFSWGSGIRTPISTSRAWRAAVAPIPNI